MAPIQSQIEITLNQAIQSLIHQLLLRDLPVLQLLPLVTQQLILLLDYNHSFVQHFPSTFKVFIL